MIYLDFSSANITEVIISTLNTIFSNLFTSLDHTIYDILDNLTFINSSIISDPLFDKTLNSNLNSNLIIIANSLLIGFVLYYAIRFLFFHYTALPLERPYQFIFKLLIFGILVNSSYFICEQIISLHSLICDSILQVGQNIFHHTISFSELITQMNSILLIDKVNFNIFSFDGIIKSFLSIGLLNLLFIYSLRYILIKVFILITPFAILTLINSSTSWFFKSWLRSFLSLLFIQSFVALVLLIVFSFGLTNSNILSQLLYIGAIYTLLKSNSYIKELIGGVSTDFNANLSSFKTLFK